MAPAAIAGVVCAMAGAVALVAGPLTAGPRPEARDTTAIARGAEIAQSRCAGCHAVALEAASPTRDAPQFRVLSRLYSAERLKTELLDIVEDGHFEMPRVRLREDEAADVAAYIASLDGGASEPAQGVPTIAMRDARANAAVSP
ncbi:MAG: c-type cytochrome [Phenylobacterium sp.]